MNNMNKDTRCLKELKIVFENCDSVVISSDYINGLYLGDISDSLIMFYSKDIDSHRTAKDVYICISLELRKENLLTEFGENAWERLVKGYDITQLHLKYFDESNEWFYVDWNKDKEFSNDYQSFEFDRLSLVIVINRQIRNKSLEFKNQKTKLIEEIDSYKYSLFDDIIFNAKRLINQLREDYLPDEVYLPSESNNKFLRVNWYEDNLDVFLIDVYSDKIEMKLYLGDKVGEIEEYSCEFIPDKLNLNDIIENYVIYKNKILDYFEFEKKEE